MTHTRDTKDYEKATFPIRISPKVRDKIKEVGTMHETYDDVLKRMLFKDSLGESISDDKTEEVISKRL